MSLVVGASALYGPGDDVVELTPSNFHSKVIDGDDLWMVEFYAPWYCGHCPNPLSYIIQLSFFLGGGGGGIVLDFLLSWLMCRTI